jgi:SAM-dependent methyltransferase
VTYLDELLDLSSENIARDHSGTPIFLLDQARRHGDLALLGEVDQSEVVIEYSLDPQWREQLGYARFVRLRHPQDGKWHALAKKASRAKAPRRNPVSRGVAPSEIPLIPYEEVDDPVGDRFGLAGAGLMAYLTRDQMHPPMIDDIALWSDPDMWPEAATAHTRAAGVLLAPRPGDRILDVGCGVGGPARQLVDEFGSEVLCIANSGLMLDTAARVNEQRREWSEAISLRWHDCQEPLDEGEFDAAWSMNMIYRVPEQEAMLRNVGQALRRGGRMMIEDWMFTAAITDADKVEMVHHFHGTGIVELSEFEFLLEACGFSVVATEDLGEVGRTHMPRYFVPLFEHRIRPLIERDFPAPPRSKQVSGKQMSDEWVAGMELTNRLYAERKMTYRRYVVERTSGQCDGGSRL